MSGTPSMGNSSYVALGAAAATVGLGCYLLSGDDKYRVKPLVDPENQSTILPDGARQSAFLQGGPLRSVLFEDTRTLYEGVRRGAKISPDRPMLGRRVKQPDGSEPYVWETYNQILKRVDDLSIGFREIGLPIGSDENIGIYSKNRPEWIITELASYNFSNVIAPIYETLGIDGCTYIMNQSEMALVVCDDEKKASGLLKQKAQCPQLKMLIVMDDFTEELRSTAAKKNVRLLSFSEVEELGRKASNRPDHVPPKPEDLATICYTSGTTGNPKGVMLTHANVMADAVGLDVFKQAPITSEDSMISFLPLAHMLERIIESVFYMTGASVGFFRGDIKLLAEDIKELAPTVVPAVPRVLNRIYDKVMSEVNKSTVKKMLFKLAMSYKIREMNKFIVRNDGFFDNLVFKKIRDGMGGRVKLLVTGSAPLAENVLTFIRAALGCIVCEGYGQTECVAAATVSIEGDAKAGHVGIPIPSAMIKLVDVPDFNYFTKGNAGEVCVKGPVVFKGYYKNPEMTKEVLDDDGWLHTGDIGRWTKEGTLKIVDRKKHIFKLSQGEYVAPEKVENIYLRSPYVMQSFVYGESLKNCVIGIVVPDPDNLIPAVKKKLGVDGTLEQLCAREDVKKFVLDNMTEFGKKAKLSSFEQVKDIYLCAEPFSIENDLLTPTLKSKRPQLKKHFKKELDAMYSKLE